MNSIGFLFKESKFREREFDRIFGGLDFREEEGEEKKMGCFSCISPPSKDVRDYDGGDIDPRSANSAGFAFS